MRRPWRRRDVGRSSSCELLRGAFDPGHAWLGDIIRTEPGPIAPTVLVVIGKTLVRERDHAVERAGGTRIPHRLDADVLGVAGVVHLVELVAAAEPGARGHPQQTHSL